VDDRRAEVRARDLLAGDLPEVVHIMERVPKAPGMSSCVNVYPS
jgi:hypothetical protein